MPVMTMRFFSTNLTECGRWLFLLNAIADANLVVNTIFMNGSIGILGGVLEVGLASLLSRLVMLFIQHFQTHHQLLQV